MKKTLYFLLLLAVVTAGCFKDEESLLPERPETQRVQPKDSVWTLCIKAVMEGRATKGLAIGKDDEEATTTVLQSVWKQNDPVQVYLGMNYIGNLSAIPDESDAHKATLIGTVTAAGIEPGFTRLTLLTPRKDWDYTGQVGVLLTKDYHTSGPSNLSVEYRYHYTMAENVLVTEAAVDTESGKASLTTENATFEKQQSIYRLSFRYLKDQKAIPAKRVLIEAANGGLVQAQSLDGTALTGPIEIVQESNDSESLLKPFFVALRNQNTTTAEALNFKVVDNLGVTYYGSKTIPAEYKANGTFVSIKNATLTGRLELQKGTTAVDIVL